MAALLLCPFKEGTRLTGADTRLAGIVEDL